MTPNLSPPDFQLRVFKMTALGQYAQFESIIEESDRNHGCIFEEYLTFIWRFWRNG
jgi:hypothetical protein